ncbi:MAG: hypothetical protein ABJG78_19955 [Cyclobacteriaceae bacterium]
MKKNRQRILVVLVMLVAIQCSEKEEDTVTAPESTKLRGSWSPYWSTLFHDGVPYEGENFIVFSDKSSQEWRKTVAELAEESLLDIKTNFNLTDEDFRFVGTQPEKKIHILTNYDQWNIAVAYRDGIIIRSKDGPNFFGDHDTWHKVFQHEITHVIEFLLIGEFNQRNSNSVWMREGFGNYGARNHRIQTVAQLKDWQDTMKDVPGEGNPIRIIKWSDFPKSVVDNGTTGEFYGFFELGVRYLLDEENGNGTSIENLKAYFEDLAGGSNQNSAFTKNFGITVSEFRDSFWILMEDYLTEQ